MRAPVDAPPTARLTRHTMSDERRIENLEVVVRALRQEVESLRGEVRRLGGARAADVPHPSDAGRSIPAPRGGPPPYGEITTPLPEPPHPRDAASALRDARPAPAVASAQARTEPSPAIPPIETRAGRSETAFGAHAWKAPEALRGLDLETLLGRYGTMALAALLTLMGVGALLTWAAARGLLGPAVRLGFGVLAAALLAVVGFRLRARGAPRYGNTLLAIALAVAHVDAWGAGPYLGLIPSTAALALAAVASAALAMLAVSDGEESLFAVGVGGALAAPFVTATGDPRTLLLLAYGWLVITITFAALRGREWLMAPRLLLLGCAVYAAAALDPATRSSSPWWLADAAASFALACAWSAWGWGVAQRRESHAPRYLLVAVGALLAAATRRSAADDVVVLAALLAASGWVMSWRRELSPASTLLAVAVVPLGAMLVAVVALDDAYGLPGAAIAATCAAIALALAYADLGARRGTHIAVSATAAAAAVLLALDRDEVAYAVALPIVAAAFALLVRRERVAAPLIPILGALLLATALVFEALRLRTLYEYTPFLTRESFAALVVVAGWAAVGVAGSRTEWPEGGHVRARELRWLVALAAVIALLWGRDELARAWSRDASTFALILYYAVTGVAAIFVGRARGIVSARRAGLALAIFGALKAVVEASDLTSVALKVGSYLLVGAFLLAVAYWYRAPSAPPSESPAHRDAEPARG